MQADSAERVKVGISGVLRNTNRARASTIVEIVTDVVESHISIGVRLHQCGRSSKPQAALHLLHPYTSPVMQCMYICMP